MKKFLGEIYQRVFGDENHRITPEQLGQLVPGGFIDKSSERREMTPSINSPERYTAAAYDSRTQAISFYRDFFDDRHQEHIFAHEIGEAVIGQLIDGSFWSDYQRIIENRNIMESADYIRWLYRHRQNPSLIIREQLADDLADFLRSKNPADMIKLRQPRLTDTGTQIDDKKMEQLYNFFAENLQLDERLETEGMGELEDIFDFPNIIDVPVIDRYSELPPASPAPQRQNLLGIFQELWRATTQPS